MENKHYLKICVGRELTSNEFEEITDIVEDEISERVASDDVIEGKDDDGMICYCFEIFQPIKEGDTALDLLNYEIDQVIPSKIKWYLESF
jgi:hypothetical protein